VAAAPDGSLSGLPGADRAACAGRRRGHGHPARRLPPASTLGGLAGVALLASGRAGRKQHIPFGPYMIAGAVLAVLAWPA
jgi:hypothetical protein